MPSILASARRPGAAVAAALTLAAGLSAATGTPAHGQRPARAAHPRSVRVHRGGHDATIRFHRGHSGETFLDATVSARGVSWARQKNDSVVVSAYVDDQYVTDIVITSSRPVSREFALGSLRAGRHTLRLHYAARRSQSRAGRARLRRIGFKPLSRTSPGYVAARYAPVLYGRNIAGLGGRLENSHTDTPLIAWHQVLPEDRPGLPRRRPRPSSGRRADPTAARLIRLGWGRPSPWHCR
jgi:hypothetical protein